MTSDISQNSAVFKKPIVFIGLMGAGKTEIGQALAQRLGRDFIDSDDLIVQSANLSIPEIFETYGEPYFRDLERAVIKESFIQSNIVMSLGGGAIMQHDIADLVWHEAYSIYLDADIDTLIERTSQDSNRPLLQNGDPRQILTDLKEKRSPVYSKASITINSNGSVEDVLESVLKELQSI